MATKTAALTRRERDVHNVISSTNGRWFGCTFQKKDGDMREINAQYRPSESDPEHWNPLDKGMMIVWDAQKEGYRTIKLATVERITINGTTHTFLSDDE